MDEIRAGAPKPCLSCYGLCPEWSEILSTDSKNPRASDAYVQHNKILNLSIIFIITAAAHFSSSKEKSMRGSLELRELLARKLLSRLSGSFLICFESF